MKDMTLVDKIIQFCESNNILYTQKVIINYADIHVKTKYNITLHLGYGNDDIPLNNLRETIEELTEKVNELMDIAERLTNET